MIVLIQPKALLQRKAHLQNSRSILHEAFSERFAPFTLYDVRETIQKQKRPPRQRWSFWVHAKLTTLPLKRSDVTEAVL